MRVIAVGDIHGCAKSLETLLEWVAPNQDDTLVTLGDYVDRGPDSRLVLDHLIRLRHSTRLIPLRGNHEQLMLDARESRACREAWLASGGWSTLISYGLPDDSDILAGIPSRHWEFLLDDCLDWFETDGHFFVHANAHPDMPLDEQPDHKLRWEHFDMPRAHYSGKVMVCGHTRQPSGRPLNVGYGICIDTWACGDGWLTALDVEAGDVWQANERGQRREAHIEDFLCC